MTDHVHAVVEREGCYGIADVGLCRGGKGEACCKSQQEGAHEVTPK
jgi:uncharacterized membrane protein